MIPDWAARPTSVPYAVFGDPQTLNLYTYVENAPLNRIDADGHWGSSTCGGWPFEPDWWYLLGIEWRHNPKTQENGNGQQDPTQTTAQKQAKPAGLIALKVEVLDTGNEYGIKIKVTYQIVDAHDNPVTTPNMVPQEKLSGEVNGQPLTMSTGTGWGNIDPSPVVKGGSKYADANGQFVDAPLGITTKTDPQHPGGPFTSVSNQQIRIKVGKETFPVRYNRIVVSSTSRGHGTLSNQTGWIGGDLNAQH